MTLRKVSDRDRRHCNFLKSTCDIGDPPPRAFFTGDREVTGDKRQGYFLNSTGDMGLKDEFDNDKRQGYFLLVTGDIFLATRTCDIAILKIDT